MGIDIQAITPSPAQTFYSVPPDLGIATARVINDNIAEICGNHPGPLCRARHGAVPGAGAGRRRARPAAQIARAARHRDRDQRRRRRSVGAALPADLRARRGAGARPVHAPDRVSRGQPLPRPLLHEHHRQPARYDRRGASPDLRRRLAGPSEPEARAVAWRRLSAGLFGPHRPCRLGPARYLHLHPAHADDLSEAALFRHDRLHAPRSFSISSTSTAPITS